jgi:hypothetical protein
MEQLRYNLLFRWFVGIAIDDTVWDHSVFSKNHDRLLEHEVIESFFVEVMALTDKHNLLSKEHATNEAPLCVIQEDERACIRISARSDGQTNLANSPQEVINPNSLANNPAEQAARCRIAAIDLIMQKAHETVPDFSMNELLRGKFHDGLSA